MSNEQINKIQRVYRTRITGGFRFTDQDGNVLRKKATRAYNYMAVQSYNYIPDGTRKLFLTFHSKANPRPSHPVYRIERTLIIKDTDPYEAAVNEPMVEYKKEEAL